LEFEWQDWGRLKGIVRAINSSEQSISPRKNRTECCQSLLPMPKAAVLDGIKGPRIGSDSALGGPGNQRAWVSGVGAVERLP